MFLNFNAPDSAYQTGSLEEICREQIPSWCGESPKNKDVYAVHSLM